MCLFTFGIPGGKWDVYQSLDDIKANNLYSTPGFLTACRCCETVDSVDREGYDQNLEFFLEHYIILWKRYYCISPFKSLLLWFLKCSIGKWKTDAKTKNKKHKQTNKNTTIILVRLQKITKKKEKKVDHALVWSVGYLEFFLEHFTILWNNIKVLSLFKSLFL